ncbi:alpha/beta fold hydrolase [Brevibacillus daliensis]|uniref:alpha/beta fold hydrolase n=1 Tax=Brevibacillus daliensis TaxID=2892995 RepID=UPI001E529312|nr:alpha/beta hydrolase [Brevibacillus daliensis]
MTSQHIHYEIYGTGRPLIIIHSLSLDLTTMKSFMEPLFTETSGWKRIYLDLPGMGKSPVDERITGSDQMLDRVLSFIDTILPGQDFAVAGMSYGGYLARGIVKKARDRVTGLLLICPLITTTDRLVPDAQVVVEDSTLRKAERRLLRGQTVVHTKETWDEFNRVILPAAANSNRQFLQSDFRKKYYAFTFQLEDDAIPFEKPVAIITGRQDSVAGYQNQWSVIEKYPRATFAVLDEAGHLLQIEKEKVVQALILDWTQRIQR